MAQGIYDFSRFGYIVGLHIFSVNPGEPTN